MMTRPAVARTANVRVSHNPRASSGESCRPRRTIPQVFRGRAVGVGAAGVAGVISAGAPGIFASGVEGAISSSTTSAGQGVHGLHQGTGVGVRGDSAGGVAVQGQGWTAGVSGYVTSSAIANTYRSGEPIREPSFIASRARVVAA